MTDEEKKVLTLLADAWNLFCELPVLHHMDRQEFCNAIHACQNHVLARPAVRDMVGNGNWKDLKA